MRTFFVSIILGCLLFANVRADHEPDHRYNIRGYVLEANQGIAGLTVQVFSDGKLLETSETDAKGYYSFHLHLHDADHRRVLKLRAGSHEAELRVTFKVGDATTARIHDANFVDGTFVEGALERFRIPTWSYAVGGLLLVIFIAVFLEKRRKKKIRLAKYGSGKKSSSSTHKEKRKKH